jgi:glucose-1-phosphate adenylyltransferase
MIEQHIKSGAGVTVAGIRVPRCEAFRFGVIEPDENGRIKAFHEKPKEAAGPRDSPEEVFASMGNYVFSARTLVDAVEKDALDKSSDHDMGGNIVTNLVNAGEAAVYDFSQNEVPGATPRDRGYWRDVGTLDSYYDAQMDLISVHPIFNLYNSRWVIHSSNISLPPAKFVFDEEGRRGAAVDSMVCGGSIIAGGMVKGSIISSGVQVGEGASVEHSVLNSGVVIGKKAVVRRAIIDKNVVVPPGAEIGVNLEKDRARGFTISEGGVVVLGKGDHVPVS